MIQPTLEQIREASQAYILDHMQLIQSLTVQDRSLVTNSAGQEYYFVEVTLRIPASYVKSKFPLDAQVEKP